jgi:hypothetical protein
MPVTNAHQALCATRNRAIMREPSARNLVPGKTTLSMNRSQSVSALTPIQRNVLAAVKPESVSKLKSAHPAPKSNQSQKWGTHSSVLFS